MKCYRECPLFDEELIFEDDLPTYAVLGIDKPGAVNTCSFYRDKECKLERWIWWSKTYRSTRVLPMFKPEDDVKLTPYEGD
jgi:hypothetical protein